MKKLFSLALAAATLMSSAAWAQDDRPTLGVAEFKNESGAAWWGGGVGWELSGLLSNELAATNAFRVVERAKLEAVLEEQNLQASGRAAVSDAAQFGQIAGAHYLVMGTVTAYEENTASTGGGISFGGVSLGGNRSEAYLAVDIRVVDTTTGEIAYSRTVEGTSKGGGMSIGLYRGGFGGNLASQKNTPAGKAIRAAIVVASEYLQCVMVERNGCEAEFEASDQRRRARTREALDLDD
jgi:curli biogenesis system outer membrane secretion channel CsgG